MNAASTVEEAQGIARRLVNHERGRCGDSTEAAINRVSSLYGVDHSNLLALWNRRARKTIAAHVYLQLKQIESWLEERANVERRIVAETAQILEQRGSPVAGLARAAADLAGPEQVT